MEPRLPSSVAKWSQPIPQDLLQLIKSVVAETFTKKIGDRSIEVAGRMFPEELWLRIGFGSPGALKHVNYECSMDLTDKGRITEDIHFMVDALGALIEEHLDNSGAEEVPRKWTPWTFSNRKVFVQSSTENTRLEAEADRLLADAGLLDDEDDAESEGDDLNSAEGSGLQSDDRGEMSLH